MPFPRRSQLPNRYSLWGHMQTLKVELGERSYPIHIGEGLLDRLELLAPHIVGRQVAIVSNGLGGRLHLSRGARSLS